MSNLMMNKRKQQKQIKANILNMCTFLTNQYGKVKQPVSSLKK